MMNKYLYLNFNSAKLFRKFGTKLTNFSTKDRFVNTNDNFHSERNELPSFIEPITVFQISNMLHVLFGERPVPSFRKTYYPKNEHIFNLAENSYLRILSSKITKNNDYNLENSQIKKSVWNSWQKETNPTWEILRRYINDSDKYKIIIKLLNNFLNIYDVLKYSFIEIQKNVQKLEKDKRLELYEEIKSLKKIEGIIYALGRYNNNKFENINNDPLIVKYSNCSAKTINLGIDKTYNLSGSIIVPIDENDIIKLENNSKGFANILDGGVVWIDKIKDFIPDELIDKYILVKEISIEKSKPNKNIETI